MSRDDLAKLKVAELREKAAELGVDAAGLKKAELVEAVFGASVKAEGFIEVSGILDILADGYGFLRTQGYLPSETDCYVGLSTIRRNGLRKGDMVSGQTRPARENEKYAAIQKVTAINGTPIEECGNRVRFGDLTPVYPDECFHMEHGKNTVTARVIDLVSPIGKGQRGLIVSPPKAGKTTVLKNIAAAITANNPDVHLMCLLVDERPEEVTDMRALHQGRGRRPPRSTCPPENHIAVSELVIERAKRLVECGKDVVVLLDSLTRLARAYNLAQPASGRILSGGVGLHGALPAQAASCGAARNIEGGGSLTILASALVDTGSKMDEVIFEEFKGTGNMELKLDRNLADRRIFPAIDPVASGTRKEELLLDPQEAPLHLGRPPHPAEHEQHRARHGHAHQVAQADRHQPGVPAAHGQEGPAHQGRRRHRVLIGPSLPLPDRARAAGRLRKGRAKAGRARGDARDNRFRPTRSFEVRGSMVPRPPAQGACPKTMATGSSRCGSSPPRSLRVHRQFRARIEQPAYAPPPRKSRGLDRRARGGAVRVARIIAPSACVSCTSAVSSSFGTLGALRLRRLPRRTSTTSPRDAVAVIDIDGTIQYDGTTCSPEGLKAQLDVAADNDHVKAVVLRVDSGGGTATAGEEMAAYVRAVLARSTGKARRGVERLHERERRLRDIRARPTIIYTAKTTAIGAIGTATAGHRPVRPAWTSSASPSTTSRRSDTKDSSYGTRPLTEEERAYYQDPWSNQINETFIQTVAEGRGMTESTRCARWPPASRSPAWRLWRTAWPTRSARARTPWPRPPSWPASTAVRRPIWGSAARRRACPSLLEPDVRTRPPVGRRPRPGLEGAGKRWQHGPITQQL